MSDYVDLYMAGSANVGRGLNYLIGASPLGKLSKALGYDPFTAIDRLAADAVDEWHDRMTPAMKAEMSKDFVRKNEFGEYEWGGAGVTTALGSAVESLPGVALSAGVGAGITRVLQTFANPIGRTVLFKRAVELKNSGVADAANQALKKLRLVDAAIGVSAFGAAEGVISAGSDAVQVYDEVQKLPVEKLMQNERYRQVLASTDEGMSETEKHAYAAEVVGKEAASTAGWQSGLTTALLGAPMGAFFGSLLGKAGLKNLASTRARAMATGALGEGSQEFLQSAAEQRIQNEALIGAGDTGRDPNAGVLNAAVGGALAGAGIGGPLAGVAFDPEAPLQQPDKTVFTADKLDELMAGRNVPQLTGTVTPPSPDYVVDPEGRARRPGQAVPETLGLPEPTGSGRILVDPEGRARPETNAEAADCRRTCRPAKSDVSRHGLKPQRLLPLPL
jgi:hypothetical protein